MHASMGMVHPHWQPLHVQSSSDDSHLLTTLATQCRVHQAGGRQQGPKLECHGDGDNAIVESQTERSEKIDCFGCGVGVHSIENNRRCGGAEGCLGRRWGSVSL